MKKRIVSLSVVMLLVISMFLSAVALVAADDDDPNTIASSKMVFQGNLTYEGGGVYSGAIAMLDENGTGYGDGESGFDIYAKLGAKATYKSDGSYVCGVIQEYDAYTTAGGWGDFYDPDCADWYNYQLRFDNGTWALEYNSGIGYIIDPTETDFDNATSAPMSGTMDWKAGYARETGAGEYYTDPGGTADNYGYALSNPCTGTNTGASAWDMDWSWGSDYVPLQYPGFDVSVTGSAGNYTVTLTPAAAGSTQLTVEVPSIVAISVDPTSIDYGQLLPGQTSEQKNLSVKNIGTVEVDVDIKVTPAATVFDYLTLHNGSDWILGSWVGGFREWTDFIQDLAMNATSTVPTRLPVPSTYTPADEENASLVFTAKS